MSLDPQVIRDSFEKVKPIANEAVSYFYEKLFADHPGVTPLFQNADMDLQKKALINSLVFIVDHIEEAEKLTDYLESLGQRHIAYGAEEELYEPVGATLLATFAHFFKDDWTEELQEQWTIAYSVIYKTMLNGAKKAEAEEIKSSEPKSELRLVTQEEDDEVEMEESHVSVSNKTFELQDEVIDLIYNKINTLNLEFPSAIAEQIRATTRSVVADMVAQEVEKIVVEEVKKIDLMDAQYIRQTLKKVAS